MTGMQCEPVTTPVIKDYLLTEWSHDNYLRCGHWTHARHIVYRVLVSDLTNGWSNCICEMFCPYHSIFYGIVECTSLNFPVQKIKVFYITIMFQKKGMQFSLALHAEHSAHY